MASDTEVNIVTASLEDEIYLKIRIMMAINRQ
jgi:hypothetical protein